VTIDWLRVVIPQARVGEVSAKFDDLFGPHQGKPGRFGLRSGREWSGGAYVAVDTPRDGQRIAPHAVVELSGSTLSPLTHDEKLGLMAFLLTVEGAHATRLDIAIDWTGEDIDIIQTIADACMSGQMTGAKRFEPMKAYKHENGKPHIVKEMIAIGARGKNGSGRYLRVYDKGLETREKQRGEWVRWELELSKDLANMAAIGILQSDDECKAMREYALGTVDFREANGKRLRDRPRCEWWSDLLAGTQQKRDTMPRRKPDADRYARWLGHSVLSSCYAYAEALDLDLADFMAILVPTAEPNYKKLDSTVGRQLLALFPKPKGPYLDD
jgi:hypothetical protein